MRKLTEKYNIILKYITAALIFAIILYPKFPFIRIPGTFVAVRLEDFLIAIAAILVFIIVLPDIGSFIKKKINIAILLYLFVGILSLISAVLITKTVVIHIGFLHWIRRIEYFVPFFVGALAIKYGKNNLEFFLKVLIVSVVIALIYGLGQRYLNWPIVVTQNEEYARGVALRYIPGSHINSTFAGHYDLGTFLVMVLPIFISLFFVLKGPRTKLLLLVAASASLWLLAFSGSRVSVLSYLVASGCALLFIKKFRAIPVVIIFSFVFFSLSPNLVARYSRIFEVTIDRVKRMITVEYLPENRLVYAQESGTKLQRRETKKPTPTPIPVFEDRSTSIRLNVEWPRALRALAKNPLLGTGYSSITLATDNDYLRSLGETGVLGFLAFGLVFVRIGRVIVLNLPLSRNYKGLNLGFLAGFTGALAGIFLNAIFIDVFEASKFATLFWLFIGMYIALVKYNE